MRQGYLRYTFPSLSPLLPCLGRIFTWLIGEWMNGNPSFQLFYPPGDPRVPATRNAPPLSSSPPITPIILSHGLAACRTSYSWLAADLASQGCLVAALEHADGSACARFLFAIIFLDICFESGRGGRVGRSGGRNWNMGSQLRVTRLRNPMSVTCLAISTHLRKETGK